MKLDKPIKYKWMGKVYLITDPDKQLWSQSEIAQTGTWPDLYFGRPVKGKVGRRTSCVQARVDQLWDGTYGGDYRKRKLWLVVRLDTKALVRFNSKFVTRVDPMA